MKRLLVVAMMALGVSGVTAGTNTFGLFYNTHYCGGCGCPGPWNAFSPTNCAYSTNASGTTSYAGYVPVAGCGPAGCAADWHGFHRSRGQSNAFSYQLPMKPPCGVIAAFTGLPGGLGCGDPYNGCGTKSRHFGAKFHSHGTSTTPPPHLWDYLHRGLGLKLGHGHGHSYSLSGSSCANGDCGHTEVAPNTAVPKDNAVPSPAPAAMPNPVSAPQHLPVGYQPSASTMGYYYVFYPGWGYYPVYGHMMGR